MITWHGKPVSTLRGKAAVRFLARTQGLDGREAQPVMAKATGNFKRGSECESSETPNESEVPP